MGESFQKILVSLWINIKEEVTMKILLTIWFILVSSFLYADTPNLSPMETYKPIYWIFGDKENQSKLQLSFQYSILKKYESGLFFGYSQYSAWDLYDQSSPFRNHDFNPEIFLRSKYMLEGILDYIQIAPYEHMSNGRDGIDNRSLDRAYLQVQWSTGKRLNVGINAKGYIYYNQAKENKDYRVYTKQYWAKIFITGGEADYEHVRGELYFAISGGRKGFQEVGYISKKFPWMNNRLFIKFYNGYCSNLLEWQEKEKSVMAGIVFK